MAQDKDITDADVMRGFPPPVHARPGPENWDLAPFNRWSFSHMRMLFPTIAVACGPSPSPLEADPIDIEPLRFQGPDGRTRSIADCLAETFTDGFLVYWRGKVRYRRVFGHLADAGLHLSQSVAKSVVGTLALLLINEGILSPDDLAEDHVPELRQCGYRGATLRHLLDMRSGVAFSEDYDAPQSDMTRVDIASYWRPPRPGIDPGSIADVILSLSPERPHGQAFRYRSIETDVLAWVIERATGRRLADLVSERIWQPMGAAREACFTVDRAGTALADGGFNATLDDYARFGRLWLEAGRDGGASFLPMALLDDMAGADASAFGEPYDAVMPRGAYRNQLWVRDVERGDLAARGVFGQLIYIDRAGDFLAVKLSSWPDHVNPERTRLTLAALDAIRAHLEAKQPG